MIGVGRRAISKRLLAIAHALSPLFSGQAGIGAGGVDEDRTGNLNFAARRMQAHRFAVAFGVRHAEISLDAAFGITTLFLTDDHKFDAVDLCSRPRKRGHRGKVRSPDSSVNSSQISLM